MTSNGDGKSPVNTQAKSESFWFNDGDIVLLCPQLDGVVFKVHLEALGRHSPLFEDMFLLSQARNLRIQQNEPGTEKRPLAIPDVSPSAFEYILSLIYGQLQERVQLRPCSRRDTIDLVSVLRAAHRLQFKGVLVVVARCTEKRLQPAMRLWLALECDIAEWTVPAFVELVLSFCNFSEPSRLPVDVQLLVQRARTTVSQRRLVYIAWRARLRSGATDGPSAEELMVVASTLAFAPRGVFDETYAAVAPLFDSEEASPRGCHAPWRPEKGELEEWVLCEERPNV